MTPTDRLRWDERYSTRPLQQPGLPDVPGLPKVFAPYERLFPKAGVALDLACGLGGVSVWLAARGLEVLGVDVSPVAIARARDLARREGIGCRFEAFDLDEGLPPGPAADVIFCNKFRDHRLDGAVIERLAPGGLLAITALSVVGGRPGLFRVSAGELPIAFAGLRHIAGGACDGEAWLLARRIE